VRILLLNWRDMKHPAGGGAEVWAHRVSEGLLDRGHQVIFFTSAVKNEPEMESINGVQMVRRGGRFGVYRQARKYFKQNVDEFDVVLEEINTRPFFASSWSDVPVVPMIHQVAKDVWKYEAPFPLSLVGRYVLEPYWLRKLRQIRVMTLSPSSAQSLLEYGITNSVVVLPGSDDDSVKFSEKMEFPTVAFLGRLVASKRPDHVVKAFRILQKEIPAAQLWMMGSGPMGKKLAQTLPNGVSLLGHVSYEERQSRLASAHVLVTTTVREGWGLNVSEASAIGTPTIGYDSPGLRDSIPMSGGRIVSVDPEELAQELIRFFRGEIAMTPKIATRPWAEVCEQIETELLQAIDRV